MVERSHGVGRLSGRRVLVIDDDQDFADSLANLLALEGYRVEAVYSAAAAQASAFPAEVALIDLRLGEGSGLDLIAAFRRDHPDTICVMMTAYASVETAIEALKRGAYDYLCKPFFTADLLATLERCFDRQTLVRERDAVEATLRARNRELEQVLADLRRSEEHLRRISENSPSAISLRDLEGRFVIVNRQFEAWHGLGAAGVAGRTAAELLPADLAQRYARQDREVLRAGRAIGHEVELRFADGTVHAVLMTTFPVLGGGGAAVGVGTISTDISAHRRAQEELRQAQKMEALGQLTGGVAHDFNNLLAVILGNLELLQERLEDGSDMAILVEDALEAARAGGELTHRLLAFGRRQTLHPQAIDLRQLITDMARMLERTLGETVEVVKVLPERLWPIEVDRHQVETSLLNLALNARDAMVGGGTLTIEAANVDHDLPAGSPELAPGRYVMIAVRDTGTGMTADVVEHAFQPFFTTKDTGQGSGLGLSMVYGFVKQSGGSIAIASAPGRGSTVRIFLPRARGTPAGIAPPQVERGRGRGETILVVEDRSDVRKLTCRLLSGLGYRVLEAGDGRAALDLLQGPAAIDLMLADVVLPGAIGGVALARRARACRPALKVIHMSGYAPEVLAERSGALEPGIGMIKKPFGKDVLADILRSTLDASD
jgi:PAS domain S-box-containing protein